MIKITHKSFSSLWKLLKHPVSAIVLSFLIAWVFYILSIKDKEPLYYISNPKVIAEKIDKEITILWKQDTVQNLKSINLSIWNNGREVIDYNDFTVTSPLTLFNNGQVNILKIESLSRSRKNIHFKPTIKNDSIGFVLSNQEALERGDGESVSVIYTSIKDGEWNLTGRVKGAKNGFGVQVVKQPRTKISNWTFYITIVLSIVFLLRIVVSYYKLKEIHFRFYEILFLVTYLLIMFGIPLALTDGELLNWMIK